jgi:hypothetical protein
VQLGGDALQLVRQQRNLGGLGGNLRVAGSQSRLEITQLGSVNRSNGRMLMLGGR